MRAMSWKFLKGSNVFLSVNIFSYMELPAYSRWYPSMGEPMIASAATSPLAPGLFSQKTVPPSRLARTSATMRAMGSTVPPGANGITIRMGREGNCGALWPASGSAALPAAARKVRRFSEYMVCLRGSGMEGGPRETGCAFFEKCGYAFRRVGRLGTGQQLALFACQMGGQVLVRRCGAEPLGGAQSLAGPLRQAAGKVLGRGQERVGRVQLVDEPQPQAFIRGHGAVRHQDLPRAAALRAALGNRTRPCPG